MSWHISYNTGIYDSDAYGVDTDSPVTPYEEIDNKLKVMDEVRISDAIREFKEEIAYEYFNTGNWDDDFWEAWDEKFRELM